MNFDRNLQVNTMAPETGDEPVSDGEMMKLTLWFSEVRGLVLKATLFAHPLIGNQERKAIRGKSRGAHPDHFSFQWTAAVQAFALLAVRSRLAQLQEDSAIAYIEGAQGSPAASLDYALTKQPQWLEELFGRDQRGHLVALRLFRRSNSERKKGGLVRISFNPAFLTPEVLTLRVGTQEISSAHECARFEALLTKGWSPHGNVVVLPNHSERSLLPAEPSMGPGPSWKENVAALLYTETERRLRETNIFHRGFLSQSLNRLAQNPSFTKILGRRKHELFSFMTAMRQSSFSSHRLGIEDETVLRSHLCRNDALRIAAPASSASAWALFAYLKTVKEYNVELDFRFPHAIDIVRRFFGGKFVDPPHACLLGISPSGTLLARDKGKSYRPIMMMPLLSHRLVVPRTVQESSGSELSRGEFLLLREDPSTSSFYLDSLMRHGSLVKKTVKAEHREPDEISSDLSSGDPTLRAILFFPHYNFNELYNNCALVGDPADRNCLQESVLFVHERIFRESTRAEALEIALRDAWLTLCENPHVLEKMIQWVITQPGFLEFLGRTSGIMHMRQHCPAVSPDFRNLETQPFMRKSG